jgi:hypothetical protein
MTRTHGHGCLRIGFAKATDRWGRRLLLGGGLGKIGSKIAGTKAGQAILNPIKDSKLFGSMTRGLSSLVNKGATAIGPVMSKISTKLTNLANKIPPDIKKFFRDPSCGRMSVAAKPKTVTSPPKTPACFIAGTPVLTSGGVVPWNSLGAHWTIN